MIFSSRVVGHFLCSLLSTSIACLVLFRPDNLKCLLRFMVAQNATVAIYFVSIAKVNDNLAFSLTLSHSCTMYTDFCACALREV